MKFLDFLVKYHFAFMVIVLIIIMFCVVVPTILVGKDRKRADEIPNLQALAEMKYKEEQLKKQSSSSVDNLDDDELRF